MMFYHSSRFVHPIKLLLSVFLYILCYFPVFGQITTTEIDQVMQEGMQKFNVAGAAIGVVQDGKVVLARGYGVKDINAKDKVDENTQFAIASNTKAFTTAALAILVDEGKISWTDKVIQYIPEFKMYDPFVTENFNIQDLLTHRSGLGLGAGDLMFLPGGSDFTIHDILTNFQYFKPVSSFRTQYDYDNLLYMVAGELIKRVTGMSWESFVKHRMLEPLGMLHSYTSYDSIPTEEFLAAPHLQTKDQLKSVAHYRGRINGAAGGIYASVQDLCQWMLVQLNHGKYGPNLEKQLFSEKSQQEMWKIHNTLDAPSLRGYTSHFAGYGLGWNLLDLNGNLVTHHGGYITGMCSRTLLVTDKNFGVVILTNSDPGGSGLNDAVVFTLLDKIFEAEDHGWMDRISKNFNNSLSETDSLVAAVWKKVATADNAEIDPENYLGIYEDKWFGKVEVFMREEQLWLKSHRSPKLNGPMQYYQANTFAIKWEYQDMNADAFAMFNLDENGKAQSVDLKGISPEIDFSFDFQDLDLQRVEK